MRAETARMNNALRNSLVVEMKNLFTEVEIFQGGRTTRTDLQSVLIIGDSDSLLRGEPRNALSCRLMSFAAFATRDSLIIQAYRLRSVSRILANHISFTCWPDYFGIRNS